MTVIKIQQRKWFMKIDIYNNKYGFQQSFFSTCTIKRNNSIILNKSQLLNFFLVSSENVQTTKYYFQSWLTTQISSDK